MVWVHRQHSSSLSASLGRMCAQLLQQQELRELRHQQHKLREQQQLQQVVLQQMHAGGSVLLQALPWTS
jgi:hypothetical protein